MCGDHFRHNRIIIYVRQEGNLVQQDSVARDGSNFWSLTPGNLFKDMFKYCTTLEKKFPGGNYPNKA